MTSRRSQLLDKAKTTITRDRNAEYGGPESSFETIAGYWSHYLQVKLVPTDVAIMLGLMKIARLQATKGGHQDSWIDLAGYAACGYEVSTAEDLEPANEEP